MWRATEHSDEENLRWAYLRAIEWINWPEFMSQPIVPVLLYFYDWIDLWLAVIGLTYFWRFVIAPRFISVFLADLGPLFTVLKFVVCPVMAFLIWQQNRPWVALLALLWPLATYLTLPLESIAEAILALIVPRMDKTGYVGLMQQRFMSALGYVRRDV